MLETPTAEVTYEEAEVGGVSGWWCRPQGAAPRTAILYLHGGAYVAGSAFAFRHFAGQIAVRAETAAFVADYRLAPEQPFPGAVTDTQAAYRGLVDAGFERIAIVGDRGRWARANAAITDAHPVGYAPRRCGHILPPWIHLALTGDSMTTRATADPLVHRKEPTTPPGCTWARAIGAIHSRHRSSAT